MTYKAEVIRSESYDPYYKVSFFYEDEEIRIEKGYAEVTRKPPRPEIMFDVKTEEKLKGNSRFKLELELLNTIMSYFFDSRRRLSNI